MPPPPTPYVDERLVRVYDDERKQQRRPRARGHSRLLPLLVAIVALAGLPMLLLGRHGSGAPAAPPASARSSVRSSTCCGVSKPMLSIGVSTLCHITWCWVLIASSYAPNWRSR